jgi:hypothetical protein
MNHITHIIARAICLICDWGSRRAGSRLPPLRVAPDFISCAIRAPRATAVSAVRESQHSPLSSNSRSRRMRPFQRPAHRRSFPTSLAIPCESLGETHTLPRRQALPHPGRRRSDLIPASARPGEEGQEKCTTHTSALLAPFRSSPCRTAPPASESTDPEPDDGIGGIRRFAGLRSGAGDVSRVRAIG